MHIVNRTRRGRIKIISKETIETIDSNGELKSSSTKTTQRIPAEPPFVKLYLSDIMVLNKIRDSSKDTFYAFIQRMAWNNKFYLNRQIKTEIAIALGTTVGTINNNLQKLLKVELIFRTSRSEYMVNPNIIAYGEWYEVFNKQGEWQLKITYNQDGTRSMKAGQAQTND